MLGRSRGSSRPGNQEAREGSAAMIKRCPNCRSTKVQEINVEMAFARGKATPLYTLGKPVVCLECGFAECFIPEEPLAKLREGVAV